MKKLIKKLRKIFKLNQVVYVIEYNNPLNIAQVTEITNRMITKFPSNCSPNRITTMVNSTKVNVTFSETCMTTDQLKHIGDSTIERIAPINTVKSVTINEF